MAFIADKTRQGVQKATGGYSIDQSLRFNDDDSAYLSRTPSSAGNRKTWTFSCWVKLGNAKEWDMLFYTGTGDRNHDHITFRNGEIGLTWDLKSYVTTAKYRDPSAWYHIVFAIDTTQTTASNRIKLYVNGSEVTDLNYNGDPGLDYNFRFMNTARIHYLGYSSFHPSPHFDGYMAEVNFIDGQALTPSDFGESGTYGEWKPIEYTGTYGTNGFYLDFSNTAAYHTITANGNAQHSTSQSKIGSSSIALVAENGDYLTIPDSDDWKLSGDFTIEGWSRQTSNGTGMMLCHSNYDGNMSWLVGITGQDGLRFVWYPSGSNGSESYVNAGGTWNTGTWYHWAVSVSGTTARFYQDGVLLTSSTMSINPFFDSSYNFAVGCNFELGNAANFYDGYLDEIRVSSTARYTSNFTPSTSAFTTDADTELLIHSDTTNGSTTFTDSSTTSVGLGNDQSSNTNNWTTNNLSATDQMLDSPTNNFCTWNPVDPTPEGLANTITEGNLQVRDSSGGYNWVIATQGMTSGKWYWEAYIDTVYNYQILGVHAGTDTSRAQSHLGGESDGWGWQWHNGRAYNSDSYVSTGTATTGDIVQVAVDIDAGKIWWGKNNTWENSGNPSAGTNEIYSGLPSFLQPAYSIYGANSTNRITTNFGQDSSFAGNKTAQGNSDDNGYGDFYYEPPTGFLALCTQNLPDPDVIPSEHFNTVTYTGAGTPTVVTGVGFQPDLGWFANRGGDNHPVYDVQRGTNRIYTNLTAAESSGSFSSFDSDGFTVNADGEIGDSGGSYVAWLWKANGSGVSNTDGTITSTVSANTDAGFSIVSWTDDGTFTGTIGHGLSQTPEFYIIKNRESTENWAVYNTVQDGSLDLMQLNGTGAKSDSGASMPTSTTIQFGDSLGDGMIAYCFHSVEGYSKVGSYTGNGSSDGTFVYTGFRPAYVMVKATSISGEDWHLFDNKRATYNVVKARLIANGSTQENTNDNIIDFTSNGFKWRDSNAGYNSNGTTYIFISFAKNPFKYSNAR